MVQRMQGFTRPTKSKPKRMVIAADAMDKEGKTTFGLSAPDPLALFNLDEGLEGVVDKYLGVKEIFEAKPKFSDAMTQQEWIEEWEKMKKAYWTALTDDAIRTLLWDTKTEAWDMLRMARLGGLSVHKDHSYKWGPVNTEMRRLIRGVYSTDKNLILLHKMKDEYEKDVRTGEKVRAGFGDTQFLVQVNIRLWKRGGTFGLTVTNCRQNAEIDGEELEGPMSNFATLATLVFPGTEMEDWE